MEIVIKSRFEKDLKKLKKQKKSFSKLEQVLKSLTSGQPLAAKYKNHPLVGNWRPCWELHIEPDWLLIYCLEEKENRLTLYRTGSHSDLF